MHTLWPTRRFSKSTPGLAVSSVWRLTSPRSCRSDTVCPFCTVHCSSSVQERVVSGAIWPVMQVGWTAWVVPVAWVAPVAWVVPVAWVAPVVWVVPVA